MAGRLPGRIRGAGWLSALRSNSSSDFSPVKDQALARFQGSSCGILFYFFFCTPLLFLLTLFVILGFSGGWLDPARSTKCGLLQRDESLRRSRVPGPRRQPQCRGFGTVWESVPLCHQHCAAVCHPWGCPPGAVQESPAAPGAEHPPPCHIPRGTRRGWGGGTGPSRSEGNVRTGKNVTPRNN